MTDWSHALEALNAYRRSHYSLPSDKSLISPVARVILQKRRLLDIHEIHNLLLEVSQEPSESLLQSDNEREFLVLFKVTFSNLPWNELSVCEAQSFAFLLVDTLQRCQADNQLINFYIKLAVAEIQGPNLKERIFALRTALIILRAIFVSFPKAGCPWANDSVKAILSFIKVSQKNSNDFDIVLEALRCLQILLRLPGKFIGAKERDSVLTAVSKYLKANSAVIAIESAKVYEAFYENSQAINKAEVNNLLELLNGGLSLRLNQYKCSPRLLEHCFELKSTDKPSLDVQTLKLNIERIRKHPYINAGMFADAFANVLARVKEEDYDGAMIRNILMSLLPAANSKTTVSPKCFTYVIEKYIERCENHSEAVNLMRFIFDNLQTFPDQYANELIGLLGRFHEKFPDSLKESHFSSFAPLTVLALQNNSVELILKVLKDQPMLLASQMTLIFAQLKGDFLRIKLGEPNVNKDAVIGLLRLFGSILEVSVVNYSNYCDADLIEKIQNWILAQFTDEADWLKSEVSIVDGLLLAAASFASETMVVTILCSMDSMKHPESLLNYLLRCISRDLDLFKIFLGSVEKYIHDLNVMNKLPQSIGLVEMFPIMKLLVESREEISLGMIFFITKLICFKEELSFEFGQVTEVYSKMFWRSMESRREYCMALFTSTLQHKTALIPSQILRCIRGILESSEVPRDSSGLIEKVQEIVRNFVLNEDFKVRLECGIVMGLMVKLFDEKDKEGINDLFEQFLKHAMKPINPCKSRVCYIMGLSALKAHLDQTNNVKTIDLTANSLIGLLASWNREVEIESRTVVQEIVASSIHALTFYLEKCGCLLNSEFYRDTCELLLEQVFWRQRCELTMDAVLGLTKCLGLYANLMPCQTEFIRRAVRLLAESSYLSSYQTLNIDLLVDISECNPAILKPSELIYKLVRRNVLAYEKGAFGKICHYFDLQVSFDNGVAFELIDKGMFLFLLERSSIVEGFDIEAQAAISFLIQKVMSITLVERFDFWLESVFENLSLTERTKSSSPAPFNVKKNLPRISLSDSAFSMTDLADSVDLESFHLTQSSVHLVVSALAGNITNGGELGSLDQGTLKRFLNCLIRICFNISAEKSQERKFYLSGISLFRGIVRSFSRPIAGGISILESFDSQIVSIISSILRASEEGDPLYAACAFAALFSLCSNRPDLQADLKEETGRVYNLVKRSIVILKEQEIYWRQEIVENLILLSIIVGLCSLMKSGFSLGRLDPDLCGILKKRIDECFDAYKDGKLEKNLRASLSGSDRLLLVEIWTTLLSDTEAEEKEKFDGVFSVLNCLNSESMETVCLLATEIFKKASLREGAELDRLLNQIVQFGLDKRDTLAIDCLMELKLEDPKKMFGYLRKFSREFLTKRFSDFDTEFGLKVLKAEEAFITDDQSILFDILRKLVSSCLNDLEVNFSKDILKALKAIFTNPQVSREACNLLLVDWINLLEEVDSIFLNQLVFFSISSNPQLWDAEGTLRELKKHFMKLLGSVNTLEMALDSWILLLKSQSKQQEVDGYGSSFDTLVDNIADHIEASFQKHRGSSIDPVWERVFGIAQMICNSSEREMARVKELSMRSLEDLNDFK